MVRNSDVFHLPLLTMLPENKIKQSEVRQMLDKVLVKLAKAQ